MLRPTLAPRDLLEVRRERLFQLTLMTALSDELRHDLHLTIQDIDRRLAAMRPGTVVVMPLPQAA